MSESEINATLTVDSNSIELTDYPREFLTQVVLAAVATLKKVDEMENVEVSLEGGKAAVTVNGEVIPLGPFPAEVIYSTFRGLVTALKGVDKNFASCKITIG